jgi:hypothetical protein
MPLQVFRFTQHIADICVGNNGNKGKDPSASDGGGWCPSFSCCLNPVERTASTIKQEVRWAPEAI